ncbi:LysM peptidoglycan-binding domain-containing protein [Burkholderia sp. AU18528]|uniref:LysM domain-containing protein n=2 Tax=Burkholderia TaxID=32008 RepID=A0ABU5WJ94_9BURK|nr:MULTISPECIES: LysM domain-containing protein [Burkholderia]MEB2502852.1 LysM domain-containing protein [Burkholderia anthinoferrum]MEB2533422.1 LysM domain-containing protein [Burkholderia anthinoferrum]MEB2561387.1 LysM domain-containing protein [Burkholderia anthinoferrum]MEB2579017.1 LysM domain-containing protein [Burkholderia anthinoferrum]KVH08010.1 peptidoglycan-binding protein [Burkholderia anthina]
MAIQAPAKTGFEKWQDGIDKAAGDAKWDSWDCEIRMAVDEYNRHLSGIAGYRPLDWQLVKAMLWVESGPANSEWNIRPMRIGVPGDPGLSSLLSGNEGGDLILPPAWKGQLTMGSVRSMPAHNIRAGIGYLLMKTAHYEYRSVSNVDVKIYEVIVKPGDNLDKIAKAQASTVDTLRKFNPTAAVLRPGQTLKYQKASVQRVITSWRQISTTLIAQRYNGGGDFNYAAKLDYALKAMQKRTGAICVE